jgi:hypothetical protein
MGQPIDSDDRHHSVEIYYEMSGIDRLPARRLLRAHGFRLAASTSEDSIISTC